MEIEVMELRTVPSLPRVLIRATVRLTDDGGDSVTLRDVRVLSTNNGVKFITLSQYRDRLPDGRWDVWEASVVLPPALQHRVLVAVLTAYQEYLREQETERVKWLAAHAAEVQS